MPQRVYAGVGASWCGRRAPKFSAFSWKEWCFWYCGRVTSSNTIKIAPLFHVPLWSIRQENKKIFCSVGGVVFDRTRFFRHGKLSELCSHSTKRCPLRLPFVQSTTNQLSIVSLWVNKIMRNNKQLGKVVQLLRHVYFATRSIFLFSTLYNLSLNIVCAMLISL